jgi:hypothetical protein
MMRAGRFRACEPAHILKAGALLVQASGSLLSSVTSIRDALLNTVLLYDWYLLQPIKSSRRSLMLSGHFCFSQQTRCRAALLCGQDTLNNFITEWMRYLHRSDLEKRAAAISSASFRSRREGVA